MTGPKNAPTRAVPCDWIANSPTRIPTAMGMTQGSSPAIDGRQALDRRKNRDRRRDHRIAVEERRREDSEQDDPRRPFLLAADLTVDEREQSQASALALVVGAHDDRDVLQASR